MGPFEALGNTNLAEAFTTPVYTPLLFAVVFVSLHRCYVDLCKGFHLVLVSPAVDHLSFGNMQIQPKV